jgi:hypothetical protein
MYILRALWLPLILAGSPATQQQVSFPTQDGGIVYADMYGKGERGVVLAHGGRFNKESWAKQAQALVTAGFRVLAIDFRGRGQSHGPQSKSGEDGAEYDVLAAVRYLRRAGAKTVSVSPSHVHLDVSGELQIDHKVDMAVDLVPQRYFLRGYDLLKNWNIPEAQCEQPACQPQEPHGAEHESYG